ncbi:MAG: biotin/lipoyl-binding protein, partial [Hyphomicrobium sp.]
MKKGSVLVWTLLLAAGAGGYVYRDTLKAEYQARRPVKTEAETLPLKAPAISVVRVAPAEFIETAMVSGSLVAREETLVSPEIEGFRVVALLVDEGDEVKKGQVLARLVADQLEAQMAQNDANRARADALIARAKSQIVEAEARQNEAEAQLERAVPLKKSGYLSGAVFDQRQSAARTSQAQLAAARDAFTAA